MSNRAYDQVSSSAQIALTEFSTEFSTALISAPMPWAETVGRSRVSSALKTTYPIPLSAAGFKKFLNEPRYRSLAHATVDLIPEMWQDGVAELASAVEAPDFFGWSDEAMSMAAAARALPNNIVATLLAGGASAVCWDGEFFFDTDHPYNPKKTSLGTYSNLRTSFDISVANVATLRQDFRKMKAANGESLGLRLTHLLVPPEKENLALEAKSRRYVEVGSNGVALDNIYADTFEVVVADELSESGVYYALAMNKPNLSPWVVQRKGSNPEVRTYGKDSEFYRETGKVAVDARQDANGALLMPQCIIRCADS